MKLPKKYSKSKKKESKEDLSNTFMITDGCVWEMNRKNGTDYPHSMEVVNVQTGQVRYIRCGSIIKFLDGQITEARNQEKYNKFKHKE